MHAVSLAVTELQVKCRQLAVKSVAALLGIGSTSCLLFMAACTKTEMDPTPMSLNHKL